MIQIQLNLPESTFSALRSTPDEFGREWLITAVVKWYKVGMISQWVVNASLELNHSVLMV